MSNLRFTSIVTGLMGACLAVLLVLIFTGPCRAADKSDQWFAPIVLRYLNGDFVDLGQAGLPIQGQHECLEALQRMIGAAQQNGAVPPGGSIIGGCLPIPAAPKAVTTS